MINSLLIISYEQLSNFRGINTRIFGLMKALKKNNVNVEVVAPSFTKPLGSEPSYQKEFNAHTIPMKDFMSNNNLVFSRILFIISFTYRVLKYFRGKDLSFQLIQAEEIYPFLSAYFLAKRMRAKLIIDDPTMYEMFANNRFKKNRMLRLLIKKAIKMIEGIVYKKSNYILCAAQKTMDYIISNYEKVEKKILLLNNGVDTDVFKESKAKEVYNNLFFNCSLPYYQNIAALRNIFRILEYWQGINFKDYTINIVISNINLVPQDIKNQIKGKSNVKVFSGIISIVPLIQESGFVLLPYEKGHFLTAGARLKALEAMACGKVIISTLEGVDGISYLENGKNLIICKDIPHIAEKVVELIQNRNKHIENLQNIKKEARNLAEKYYSWDKLINSYNNIEE